MGDVRLCRNAGRNDQQRGTLSSGFLHRKYCVVIKLKSADSYRAKNAPLMIALRWNGVMSQKRPAAGGEFALHILFMQNQFQKNTFFIKKIVLYFQ